MCVMTAERERRRVGYYVRKDPGQLIGPPTGVCLFMWLEAQPRVMITGQRDREINHSAVRRSAVAVARECV